MRRICRRRLWAGSRLSGPSKDSGDLTHPDRTRGANDRWFGYANNWDLWNIYNDYSHRLGYAFAMVFGSAIGPTSSMTTSFFRPFYYCTSYCATNPRRGYWLGRDDGDDNKGTCYIDGVPVGNFVGNLINDGSEGRGPPCECLRMALTGSMRVPDGRHS